MSAWFWLRRGSALALGCALCLALLPAPAAAQPTPAPAEAASAPAPAASRPYNDAVAARFPDPAVPYDTPGLQPGREVFTTNGELDAALHTLAAAPGGPKLIEAGRSLQGQPLLALLFSRGPNRPRVLLMAQQHGDEPAGSEALLVLARELAAGSPLLDQLDVLLLPRANPDGAALGARRNAHGLDINRDHLLLHSPEAQAAARLVQAFDPLVVVDLHEHTVMGRYLEKFNAIQRHDMLLQTAMTANLPTDLQRAADSWFQQPLHLALAQAGLTSESYYTNATTPGDLRLAMGGAQPDTARNVNGLAQRISLLLESRGIGIGRLHVQRRVHSHVVALHSILQSTVSHAAELASLRHRLQADVAAAACQGTAVVLAAQTPTQRELLMLDPATGADKPITVRWQSSLTLRPLISRARPCGYWLSAEAEAAVQRLQQLGVQAQRLDAALPLHAETWFETARMSGSRPDVRGSVEDAQEPRLIQAGTRPLRLLAPAGGWWISLAQPAANLAVAALEPDSPNSYFANHLLTGLTSAARVMVPPEFPVASTAPPVEAAPPAVPASSASAPAP